MLVDPPNRSELASKPVPALLGAAGGGVGRLAFGVGADEFVLDVSFTSGALFFIDICGLGARTFESMSIAPSIFDTVAVEFDTDGEGIEVYEDRPTGFCIGVGE